MRLVEGKNVVKGDIIFRLMDTYGIPLDLINDRLREQDMGFNIVTFCRAALASGNYKKERLRHLFCPTVPWEELARCL